MKKRLKKRLFSLVCQLLPDIPGNVGEKLATSECSASSLHFQLLPYIPRNVKYQSGKMEIDLLGCGKEAVGEA
jgi:hypothetical protein